MDWSELCSDNARCGLKYECENVGYNGFTTAIKVLPNSSNGMLDNICWVTFRNKETKDIIVYKFIVIICL